MGNLAEIAKKGDKVMVWNPNNDLDPNIYSVTSIKQSIVELENIATKKFHRVHKTRIAKIIVDEDLEEVQKAMDKTAEKPEVKKPAKKKVAKKPKPEKVNFKQMIADGNQVFTMVVPFTKDGTTPVDNMKVESHCVIAPDNGWQLLDEPSGPVGVRRGTKPQITELPTEAGTMVVVYTDGLETAGARSSRVFDVPAVVRELTAQGNVSAQQLADRLLERALALDEGRPHDDISVLVLRVLDRTGDDVRRLVLTIPL